MKPQRNPRYLAWIRTQGVAIIFTYHNPQMVNLLATASFLSGRDGADEWLRKTTRPTVTHPGIDWAVPRTEMFQVE
jgi:hypothetical protein